MDTPDLIIATGFADDKVSKQAAYDEALRMCRHFSRGDGQCRVVDEQISNGSSTQSLCHSGLLRPIVLV